MLDANGKPVDVSMHVKTPKGGAWVWGVDYSKKELWLQLDDDSLIKMSCKEVIVINRGDEIE